MGKGTRFLSFFFFVFYQLDFGYAIVDGINLLSAYSKLSYQHTWGWDDLSIYRYGVSK